ncbi:MAG: DUF2776 domain-containing protein [Alistipes sp.]|nr:DUF2776 domain-containing protein [Alistipes sp.]MDE6862334.1 DUF2776 domain-containing protein [Alistipes sp.]MDE7129004.1 DUF2776 domain-containing protein [Alistipes sp.]
MNYGISVLFRAIPLVMALICMLFGWLVYDTGDDAARLTAGTVIFFLGSICIALFCTAATIIRQITGTYRPALKFVYPFIGYAVAIATLCIGIWIFHTHTEQPLFVAGHVVAGLGLITMCVSTAATSSVRFTLIPENSKRNDSAPNPAAYSRGAGAALNTIVTLVAIAAWAWAIILLLHADDSASYLVAGTVMGGIACVCTGLIALVVSIVRQTRNTYTDADRHRWPSLVLGMGTAALVWGAIIIIFDAGNSYRNIGCIMIGLGLICYSISSKVLLLAKVWRADYPLAKRIPLIPVLTALTALFLAAFLFEYSTVDADYFTPAHVLVGFGAICFTLFSIVSILESGTSSGK